MISDTCLDFSLNCRLFHGTQSFCFLSDFDNPCIECSFYSNSETLHVTGSSRICCVLWIGSSEIWKESDIVNFQSFSCAKIKILAFLCAIIKILASFLLTDNIIGIIFPLKPFLLHDKQVVWIMVWKIRW